jgi:hypothetical protein
MGMAKVSGVLLNKALNPAPNDPPTRCTPPRDCTRTLAAHPTRTRRAGIRCGLVELSPLQGFDGEEGAVVAGRGMLGRHQ